MSFKFGDITDLDHFTRLFHGAIPGQLSLRLRPGLGGAVPSRQSVLGLHIAGDLGRHTEADPATPHFRERDRSFAAIDLVGETGFALADFVDGPREIAVPFQRIHRQVEVGIKNEHDRYPKPSLINALSNNTKI